MKTKQRLLTIGLGTVMQTFIERQSAGERIVSISPHYHHTGMLYGYFVVVEPNDDPKDAQR